MTKHLPPLQQ